MSDIVLAPSPVLRQVAKPVEAIDKRVLLVLEDMEKTLKKAKDPQGVGLAAPQIGVSLRIFLSRPTKDGPITIFINPEITKFSQAKNKPTSKNGVYEGCLSIPSHYSPIERSKSVTVKYRDEKFVEKTESFSGFAAHVIQHEMDHLNGILFIDRCLEQNTKLYRIVGEEWEEVGI
jgi:peptide deformylase